jgi:hypothetical protein
VKVIKLIFIFTIISSPAANANALRLSLISSFYSTNLVGEDDASGKSGKLVSQSNLHYGFKLSYAISQSFRLQFAYKLSSYDFDNTDDLITGDTKVNASSTEVGFKWIMFATTAFRLSIVSEDVVAFELNNSNKAKLFKSKINAFHLNYDQILYLGSSVFAGIKLGYEMGLSGDEVTNKQGSNYGAFVILNTGMGSFEGFYQLKSTTKETDSLDFTDEDSIFNIIYTVSF